MSPFKQAAVGLGGCVLAPGRSVYKLKNGTQTHNVAVTVSLLRAEPSLRRLSEAVRINCEEAAAQGYSFVRCYDDAVALGVV